VNTHIERSRNGHEVLFVDSKATASTIDPVKEATSWVETTYSTETVGIDETLVVIGASSGYHVEALRKRTSKKIVVIDTCPASIEFVQRRLASLNQITYIEVKPGTTFSEFFQRNEIVAWVFEPFTLLRHRSSMVRNADLSKVEECLVGRTIEAFRAQLAARPAIASALNSVRLKKLAEAKLTTKGLVSVRDLTSVWEVSSEPSNERRLLRVLEELVR
jgi:hypothetical protein